MPTQSSGEDEVLIEALAGGATLKAAAQRARVPLEVANDRLAWPGFRPRVEDARNALLNRTGGQLAAASTRAVACLERLLEAESESVQLGASRAIIELVIRLRQAEELERRLRAVEAAAAGEPAYRGGSERWGA